MFFGASLKTWGLAFGRGPVILPSSFDYPGYLRSMGARHEGLSRRPGPKGRATPLLRATTSGYRPSKKRRGLLTKMFWTSSSVAPNSFNLGMTFRVMNR